MLPRLMPGNPAILLMGEERGRISPELLAGLQAKLQLDKPLYVQFSSYFLSILKGDWGFSYINNQYVSTLILSGLKNTLSIAVPVIILSSVIAIALGSLAGYYENSRFDGICTSTMIAINSVPTFLLGMLLLYIFGFKLGWFPLAGLKSTAAESGLLNSVFDRMWSCFLPVATLTLASVTSKYLLIRNNTVVEKNSKYVVYAQARGLSNGKIIFQHIFKNACQPFISILGMNIGFIFSGSLVIEVVYSIRGMGMLIYNAAANRDYVVLQGCFLILAALVISSNLLADIVVMAIDPRIRKGTYHEG